MTKKARARFFTMTKGKKRKTNVRIGIGPPLFFIGFCLIALAAGICINSRYYEMAKTHTTRPDRP
jgi:hypothetical protein